MSKELHQRLTCNICFKYFPTINFIKIHKKEKHSQNKTKNNWLYQQLNSNLNYEAPNILNNQLISTSPSENQSYYQPALKIFLSQKETFSQSNQSNINSIVDSELEYLLDQTLVSHETPLAFNSNFIEDFDFLPSTSTRFFDSLNSRDAFSDFE